MTLLAPFLGILLLQQPEVAVSVDRTEVAPGDTVVLTITVTALGNEPLRITGPDLEGLELVDQRERSRVEMAGGVARRLTVRTIRVRAVAAGHASARGIRAEQAGRVAEAAPLTIVVLPALAPAATLEPALRRLIEQRAPPDSPDRPMVSVVPSKDTVVLGDQVDVVTVAWFPRDLRSRLRAAPSFQGPETRGAWTYQHAPPAGIALSRQVGGRWYDAFVQYQAIFPLKAGPMSMGPASVAYSVPVTYGFLSRELRHVVQSDSLVIAVRALPAAGQPDGFRGAAGRNLVLRAEPTRLELEVGEARTVTLTLEGQGNVALWPEPELRWPQGLRAYPGESQVQASRENGVIGGTKTFTSLVVADSAGRYRVPGAAYTYYDLAARRYVQLSLTPLEVIARPGPGLVVLRAEPPPLLRGTQPWLPPASRLPPGVWIAVGLLPLVVLALARRQRSAAKSEDRPAALSRLEVLERHFRRELERLVPEPASREGSALADALRAAGVEVSLASHVARVRDRLQLALYGPAGSGDPEELSAEVEEVLRALVGERPGAPRAGLFSRALVMIAWLAVPVGLKAQSASAERLYEAGAFRAAADSFAARAAHQPEVAAHWYNLGNAWYRLGATARAAAAWQRAARLSPRNRLVAQARSLVPAPDRFTERVLWVGPLTPDEALGLALALWVVGSLMLAWRRMRAVAIATLLAGALSGALGLGVQQRYRRPVALALAAETPLREAPYGAAPASARLGEGAAVVIEQARSGWYLVSHAGRRGWVRSVEVVIL